MALHPGILSVDINYQNNQDPNPDRRGQAILVVFKRAVKSLRLARRIIYSELKSRNLIRRRDDFHLHIFTRMRTVGPVAPLTWDNEDLSDPRAQEGYTPTSSAEFDRLVAIIRRRP